MDYDRGSGPYRDGRPVRSSDLRQKILNESWPLKDSAGFHARGIHDRPVDQLIPCRVRIVRERDGEEILDGIAARWNRSHVYVTNIDDPRMDSHGVWVRARDVRRRE